jgi:hypothetical protein
MYQRETIEALREKLHRAKEALHTFDTEMAKVEQFGRVATEDERPVERDALLGLTEGIRTRVEEQRARLLALDSNTDQMEWVYVQRQSEMNG